MTGRPLAAALAAALLAAGCASTAADPTAAPAPKDLKGLAAAQDRFDRAVAQREKGNWDDAKSLFREVYEDTPASPLAEEAQFQAAECAYGAERYAGAAELFAKFVQDRPLSARVGVVEKRLYDIGDYLIEDGKSGFLGMGFFTSSEEGVRVLRNLATVLPTGSWADDALMRIGRWYAETRDYAAAEAALDELLKTHPFSEWRLEARFLLAWTFRKDNRGPEYDGEALRRARAHFLAYIEQATSDPDRAKENEEKVAAAKEEIVAIDGDMARKAMARAKLYVRMGKDRAALAVLQEAAKQWGATDAGKECAARAQELATRLGLAAATIPAPAPDTKDQ